MKMLIKKFVKLVNVLVMMVFLVLNNKFFRIFELKKLEIKELV